MRIVNRTKVEDCFDGSSVYTYELSAAWTEEHARRLSRMGHFQYYSDFPRPLFKLRTEAGLFASGVVGCCDCRVVLPRINRGVVQRALEEVLMSG